MIKEGIFSEGKNSEQSRQTSVNGSWETVCGKGLDSPLGFLQQYVSVNFMKSRCYVLGEKMRISVVCFRRVLSCHGREVQKQDLCMQY